MRMRVAWALGALLLLGCEAAESDGWPTCEGYCEQMGCVDGVAWNCANLGLGPDCGWLSQLPPVDCAAQGLSCWIGPDPHSRDQYYCARPGCGDAVVQQGEDCDDGSENGTTLAGCTADCALPQPLLDVAVPADGYEQTRIDYRPDLAQAEQRFIARSTGTALRLVLPEKYREAWLAPARDPDPECHRVFAGPPSALADGTWAFEFTQPVHLDAGSSWLLGVQCVEAYPCTIPLLQGDPLPDGSFHFRELGDRGVPVVPEGSDLQFELWIVPDAGTAAERAR